jgi:hypothetical protein
MPTDEEYYERNASYADHWLGRWGDRVAKIVKNIVNGETVQDTTLEVRVYVPSQGIVHLPVYQLLTDSEWRNGVEPNARNQCKVLDDTFLAAPIYQRLQDMGNPESES